MTNNMIPLVQVFFNDYLKKRNHFNELTAHSKLSFSQDAFNLLPMIESLNHEIDYLLDSAFKQKVFGNETGEIMQTERAYALIIRAKQEMELFFTKVEIK